MSTASTTARSTRATTKFKYQSKRVIGGNKTLVTTRIDNEILDKMAKEGNDLGLSMSATFRRVLRRGLGMPEEDVNAISAKKVNGAAKKAPAKKAAAKKAAATKPAAAKTAAAKTAAKKAPAKSPAKKTPAKSSAKSTAAKKK